MNNDEEEYQYEGGDLRSFLNLGEFNPHEIEAEQTNEAPNIEENDALLFDELLGSTLERSLIGRQIPINEEFNLNSRFCYATLHRMRQSRTTGDLPTSAMDSPNGSLPQSRPQSTEPAKLLRPSEIETPEKDSPDFEEEKEVKRARKDIGLEHTHLLENDEHFDVLYTTGEEDIVRLNDRILHGKRNNIAFRTKRFYEAPKIERPVATKKEVVAPTTVESKKVNEPMKKVEEKVVTPPKDMSNTPSTSTSAVPTPSPAPVRSLFAAPSLPLPDNSTQPSTSTGVQSRLKRPLKIPTFESTPETKEERPVTHRLNPVAPIHPILFPEPSNPPGFAVPRSTMASRRRATIIQNMVEANPPAAPPAPAPIAPKPARIEETIYRDVDVNAIAMFENEKRVCLEGIGDISDTEDEDEEARKKEEEENEKDVEEFLKNRNIEGMDEQQTSNGSPKIKNVKYIQLDCIRNTREEHHGVFQTMEEKKQAQTERDRRKPVEMDNAKLNKAVEQLQLERRNGEDIANDFFDEMEDEQDEKDKKIEKEWNTEGYSNPDVRYLQHVQKSDKKYWIEQIKYDNEEKKLEKMEEEKRNGDVPSLDEISRKYGLEVVKNDAINFKQLRELRSLVYPYIFDLKKYSGKWYDNVYAYQSTNEMFQWDLIVRGPAGSPYQGGTFFAVLTLPRGFPFEYPMVKFRTLVVHPLVEQNGCYSNTKLYKQWTYRCTIEDICLAISTSFKDPCNAMKIESSVSFRRVTPDTPIYQQLAIYKPLEFIKAAKQATIQYAITRSSYELPVKKFN